MKKQITNLTRIFSGIDKSSACFVFAKMCVCVGGGGAWPIVKLLKECDKIYPIFLKNSRKVSFSLMNQLKKKIQWFEWFDYKVMWQYISFLLKQRKSDSV